MNQTYGLKHRWPDFWMVTYCKDRQSFAIYHRT